MSCIELDIGKILSSGKFVTLVYFTEIPFYQNDIGIDSFENVSYMDKSGNVIWVRAEGILYKKNEAPNSGVQIEDKSKNDSPNLGQIIDDNQPKKPVELSIKSKGKRISPLPQWYKESRDLLAGLGIGRAVRIARNRKPDEISSMYSALENTLGAEDARYLLRQYPKILEYPEDRFSNYVGELSGVSSVVKSVYESASLPKEFDLRRSPHSFATLEGLLKLKSRFPKESKPADYPARIGEHRYDLSAYGGKKILFIGVNSPEHKETLSKRLQSVETVFHDGQGLKGLGIKDYDLVVCCSGTVNHKVTDKLKAELGGFNQKVIYALGATNPQRLLQLMGQHAKSYAGHDYIDSRRRA